MISLSEAEVKKGVGKDPLWRSHAEIELGEISEAEEDDENEKKETCETEGKEDAIDHDKSCNSEGDGGSEKCSSSGGQFHEN